MSMTAYKTIETEHVNETSLTSLQYMTRYADNIIPIHDPSSALHMPLNRIPVR